MVAQPTAGYRSNSGTNIGKPISQLKTAEDLCNHVTDLKRNRQPLERQWKLNLAFYKGRQYAYYPPRSNRLETLAIDEGLKPRHRVRLVSNQLMPGTHTLLAQLTKTKPRMFATPGSGNDHEIRAAQMAESLLEYWWDDFGLDEKLDEALLWSIIASAGYWLITWDDKASKQMRFVLGPDGQPIVDEGLKQAFIAQLKNFGVQPVEKVIYMGDVKVDVLSPMQTFCDPGASVFEDCKYVITVHNLDPDEVKARYGVDVIPDAAPISPDVSMPFQYAENGPSLTLRKVYCMYVRPNPANPDGRVVEWIEGNDKKILRDSKWPYHHDMLPVVKFAGMRIPGQVYDDAVLTHALPLQKELNRTISQIVEYKNLTINPVMTAPVGSLRTRRTTEPGQVLEYTPIGGQNLKPEFETLPTLPPYVFEHLADISKRLQDIFLSPEVIQGKVPPNVEAGVAIDLLQEMATDRLAPVIKLMEASLGRAGEQMVSLAQQYYIEPRLLKIRGSGGSVQVKQFQQADIDGNVSIHVETGSGLPRTRAGRQARIERMVELQIIPPNKAYKYFDLGDLGGLEKQIQADEDMAYRNIDKLLQGIPLNPEGVQDALQKIQQGIDPTTGQPLQVQDPQQIQQMLKQAGLQPQPGIDYQTHMDITSLFMKGVEYEQLPTNIRQDFVTYWSNLMEAWFHLPVLPQPQAPKVNLQVKSTLGPTATSKILERSGIDASPQDTMEPPLETWVSDSVDKPDTDMAGPGQEAKQLSEAAQIELEATIADAQAKAKATQDNLDHAATHVQGTMEATRAQETHDQSMAHADQLHQLQMQKEQANVELARKKLAQSNFKPKPASKGK